MQRPGTTNLAFFFTSAVAMLARDSSIFFTLPDLSSQASPRADAKALFDMILG